MGSAQADLTRIGCDILMSVNSLPFTGVQFIQQVFFAVSGPVKCNRMTNRHCCFWFQVAIIIPFRHRENHLKYWLHYLHPILRRQKIDYGIYIINQVRVAFLHAVSCVPLAKVTLKRGRALLIGVAMANRRIWIAQQRLSQKTELTHAHVFRSIGKPNSRRPSSPAGVWWTPSPNS